MKMSTTIKVYILNALALLTLPIHSPLHAADAERKTSLERVVATEKGKLENPLTITPEIIAEGKELYQTKTCGACHGGNGGGIHCPSLINENWIYGGDDDTLFRLVALGSEGIAKAGYSRGDKEKHAGPMPAFGQAISDEQDLWKIVSYIRSLQPGFAPK
ncbi:MAG TPA: c-type cytochrome [Hyphomicrobium sp.]|nr:c-type cytochrome [Hyphomicrobium sp.]